MAALTYFWMNQVGLDDYCKLLYARQQLMQCWTSNLMLYKYNPNSPNPNMLQDYQPTSENLTAIGVRQFNFLQTQYQLYSYDNPLIEKIQKEGIHAIRRFSTKELTRVQIQNNNLVRLIIKQIVSKIDLLDFIRHYPEAAAILLSQRATEEQQFLPSELSILFCYAKTHCAGAGTVQHKRETCYFKQLWDQYKLLHVDYTIKMDILLRFAVESAETCVLSYFLDDSQNRDKFFQLSLNTYATINTHSFNHLFELFQKYDELEQFLYTKDAFGLLPIHAAAFLGNIKVLKTILIAQENISLLSTDGMSILDCVLCSKNPLAVKLIIEHLRHNRLLNLFLYQLSTKYQLNAFFYPVIFHDVNTLSLLCKCAKKQLLFKQNAFGVDVLTYASRMQNVAYFSVMSQLLDGNEKKAFYKDLLYVWKNDNRAEHTETSQFRFSNPVKYTIEQLKLELRQTNFLKSYGQLIFQVFIYLLMAAIPFVIFPQETYQESHFMLAQTFVIIGLLFKVSTIAILTRKHPKVGQAIDLYRVKYHMFDRIKYCAMGDQIFDKERVQHCSYCNQCSIIGSIHSSMFGRCIPPRRTGFFLGQLIVDIFVMTQEILLIGHPYNKGNSMYITIQIILCFMIVFTVVWLSNELLGSMLKVQRRIASQKAAASPARRRPEDPLTLPFAGP